MAVDALSKGLNVLLENQKRVSEKLGDLDPTKVRQSDVSTYATAMMSEIIELANELGWKPWKELPNSPKEVVLDEWADVLAFLGVFMILIEKMYSVSPNDFALAYMKKVSKNIKRMEGLSGEPGYIGAVNLVGQ